jgi:hypothetical protein
MGDGGDPRRDPKQAPNERMEAVAEQKLSAREIREFTAYLRNCTDAQVRGVYEKERAAGREPYVQLAFDESERREIGFTEPGVRR